MEYNRQGCNPRLGCNPLNMKTSFNSLFLRYLSAAVLLLLGASCQAVKEDKEASSTVIKVGSSVITRKAYNEALKRFMPEDAAGISPAELNVLKNDLAAQLIEEELILSEARKMNIDATADEVAAESDRIKAASGDDAFRETIARKYGAVEGWEQEIKRRLIVKKTVSTSPLRTTANGSGALKTGRP